MQKPNRATKSTHSYPEGELVKYILPVIFLSLALFYLVVFKDIVSRQAPADVMLGGFCGVLFLGFGFYIYRSQRRVAQLHQQISLMIETCPSPVLVTDLRGSILFKNKKSSLCFPALSARIEELAAYCSNPGEQDKLRHFLHDLEADLEIEIQHQGPYILTGCVHPQHRMIIWTLKPDDPLKKGHNAFQKSIDLRYLFNTGPARTVILDQQGCIQTYNDSFLTKAMNNEEIPFGTSLIELLSPSCQADLGGDLVKLLSAENPLPLELEFKNGTMGLAQFEALEFPDSTNEFNHHGFILQVFDNSEHRKLQQRLSQSQKLQALGQLAGGIAHDFNNLLTAMVGFCDLLLLRHSPGDESFTDIQQIKQTANRATNLIRQLLAFSRKQTLQPVVLDVSETLADLFVILQRLIGPSIELKIIHGRDLEAIRADRGQFEQVIINLVVNARDAIKEAGTITLKTSNYSVYQPTSLGYESIQPGDYVLVEVADTGCGIALTDLTCIFDPFFSTKDVGAGTGLGLSTVYGIVKQTGGYITVESTPNSGTRFTILIPKAETQDKTMPSAVNEERKDPSFRDLTGSGTILLVEDEDSVRMFATRALSDKGYTVIEARNGQDALGYLMHVPKHTEPPQLLITDVIMPKMDGPHLVREAVKIFPHLKVIYVSGYAEEAFRSMISQDEHIHFLTKPFSLKALANKVKEIFDQIEHEKVEQVHFAEAG